MAGMNAEREYCDTKEDEPATGKPATNKSNAGVRFRLRM
jgi:hypothetical protein